MNDSNLIFAVSKDKSLKLTDLKHEQNILSIETAHDNPINCLTIIYHWLIQLIVRKCWKKFISKSVKKGNLWNAWFLVI